MSSSPDNGDLILPTSIELSRLLATGVMATEVADAFQSRPIALARLREFRFVAQNINEILRNLERHRVERQFLYTLLMNTPGYRERMNPIYLEYRRRQQLQNDPPIYANFPPDNLIMPSSRPDTEPQLSPSSSSSSSLPAPQDIEIHSIERTTSTHSQSSSEGSLSSFHTALVEEPRMLEYPADEEPGMWDRSTWGPLTRPETGTRQFPIDVDRIPDAIPSALTLPYTMRKTRSAPVTLSSTKCRVCKKNGHQPSGCVQLGPIVCTHCQEVNAHVKGDCPIYRRKIRDQNPHMQFCLICSQSGHQLENCPLLSPNAQ